jgi:hypothetical protein
MWIDVEQNTDEWFELRLSKITSSNMPKIMANYDKAFGKPAIEYAEKIALEHLTGIRDETSFSNGYMERGHELEPLALKAYEIEEFSTVTNGGFFIEDTDDIIKIGDSNDGNVGEDGCIEIKSVIPKTQWKRIKSEKYDSSYQWQIHSHIWIGGKKWCDFVSYCPEMPQLKQCSIYRIDRDEEKIAMMKKRTDDFKSVVLDHIEMLK